jgi:hypothetical protein
MELLAGFIVGFITNYLTPIFDKTMDSFFGALLHRLDKDRINLTGTWQQTYTEPPAGGGDVWITTTERIELKQGWKAVTGTGETTNHPRTFQYELTIKHDLVFGNYEKKGQQGNLTGTGMTQMIVSKDRKTMIGQATWLDSDTNQIESCKVSWVRL